MSAPTNTVPTTEVLAIIPAYNEAEALPDFLVELESWTDDDQRTIHPVIVDDGSTDATAAIARDHDATVLELPFNLGVGGAVRAGLRYALAQEAEQVVIIDADGQHDPSDIRALLAALDNGADMAIGSRFADGSGDYDMGVTRRGAQRLLNYLVRKATGFRATDATSGFRAFDRSVVSFLADRYPVEYLADTVEVIVLVQGAGLQVVEVPVGMRRRQGGTPSKGSFGLLFNYLRLLVGVAGTAVIGRSRRVHS